MFFSNPTSTPWTPWFNTKTTAKSQIEFRKDHGETNTIGFDQKARNRGDPNVVVGTDRCDIHLSFCSRTVLSVSLFHKKVVK